MKKIAFTILLSLSALLTYSQIHFEPGYFIDNSGNKIDCLIKNTDRMINPVEFEYKLSENASPKIASIDAVREFGILNTIHRYVRATVLMDRSSEKVAELDNRYAPDFQKEVIFLRVLIAGKASLYAYYGSGGLKRFFYQIDESPIEQLVYKKFISKNNLVSENVTFRQQLLNSLTCGDLPEGKFNRIAYSEKALITTFETYNQCVNATYESYETDNRKSALIITINAGVNTSALETTQKLTSQGQPYRHVNKFSSRISPVIGVGFEYNFPTNNHRWSAIIDPTLQFFKGTYPVSNGYISGNLIATYTHLTVPLGVKRYLFIRQKSSLAASVSLAYSIIFNASNALKTEGLPLDYEFQQKAFMAFPFGVASLTYQVRNRYSIQATYNIEKTMQDSPTWTVKFRDSASLTVGYRLK